MNGCAHTHLCFECDNHHSCDLPECQTLVGAQRLCYFCSFLYGWAAAKNKDQHDSNEVL